MPLAASPLITTFVAGAGLTCLTGTSARTARAAAAAALDDAAAPIGSTLGVPLSAAGADFDFGAGLDPLTAPATAAPASTSTPVAMAALTTSRCRALPVSRVGCTDTSGRDGPGRGRGESELGRA